MTNWLWTSYVTGDWTEQSYGWRAGALATAATGRSLQRIISWGGPYANSFTSWPVGQLPECPAAYEWAFRIALLNDGVFVRNLLLRRLIDFGVGLAFAFQQAPSPENWVWGGLPVGFWETDMEARAKSTSSFLAELQVFIYATKVRPSIAQLPLPKPEGAVQFTVLTSGPG